MYKYKSVPTLTSKTLKDEILKNIPISTPPFFKYVFDAPIIVRMILLLQVQHANIDFLDAIVIYNNRFSLNITKPIILVVYKFSS